MKTFGIQNMAIAFVSIVAAGCGAFGLGMVCNSNGCAPGVVWEVGFCLPGDEERYPACEEDDELPDVPPEPEDFLSNVVFRYDTAYGINVSGQALFGDVQLFEDGILKNSYSTMFTTVADYQKVAVPGLLATQIEADATSVDSYYTLRLVPPNFNLTTAAPAGALVTLNGTVEYYGLPVNSGATTFVASGDGGPLRRRDDELVGW